MLSDNAVIPKRAHPSDIGADLTATSMKVEGRKVTYGTGLAVKPPKGYYFEILPRSSVSKKDLMLCNSVGVIDPNYRGELLLKFQITAEKDPQIYALGDKIGQLVLRKSENYSFNIVETLDQTDRGTGGFGSTGK